jgi:hypothetical protein
VWCGIRSVGTPCNICIYNIMSILAYRYHHQNHHHHHNRERVDSLRRANPTKASYQELLQEALRVT